MLTILSTPTQSQEKLVVLTPDGDRDTPQKTVSLDFYEESFLSYCFSHRPLL